MIGAAPVRFVATLLLVLLVYGLSLYFVDFDLGRLWSGLPRLGALGGQSLAARHLASSAC